MVIPVGDRAGHRLHRRPVASTRTATASPTARSPAWWRRFGSLLVGTQLQSIGLLFVSGMIAHVTLGGGGRPQAHAWARPGPRPAASGGGCSGWRSCSGWWSCWPSPLVGGILLVGIFAFDAPLAATRARRRRARRCCSLVGYVWFWVRVRALAVPTLMLEPVGIFGALGRAVRLTRQQFWRLFGIAAARSPWSSASRAASCGCRSASPARCSSTGSGDAGYGLLLYLLLTAVGVGRLGGGRCSPSGRGHRPAVRRPAHPQGGVRRRAARPRPGSCPR